MALLHTSFLTTLALIAFAGNSVLCRLALEDQLIDAGSFTAVRLISGAVVLMVLVAITLLYAHKKAHTQAPKNAQSQPQNQRAKTPLAILSNALSYGHWAGALWLFIYAAGFSYAYIVLGAGMGALILFGSVQITLVVASLMAGQALRKRQWLGLAIAFAGFITLVMPGASRVNYGGFSLMAIAGVAWGLYTLAGRKPSSKATTAYTPKPVNLALLNTAGNFLRAGFMALCLLPLLWTPLWQLNMSSQGLWLAIAAGAITSGLGYAIWYAVLPHLSVIAAGVLQLLVPLIAVLGGVIFVGEHITFALLMAGGMILGGVLLVTFKRS